MTRIHPGSKSAKLPTCGYDGDHFSRVGVCGGGSINTPMVELKEFTHRYYTLYKTAMLHNEERRATCILSIHLQLAIRHNSPKKNSGNRMKQAN